MTRMQQGPGRISRLFFVGICPFAGAAACREVVSLIGVWSPAALVWDAEIQGERKVHPDPSQSARVRSFPAR